MTAPSSTDGHKRGDAPDGPEPSAPERPTIRQAVFIGVGNAMVSTTLVNEPSPLVAIGAVLLLSVAADIRWKRSGAARVAVA
jgi:hypothetical protein